MWVDKVGAYIDIALGLFLAKATDLSSSLNLIRRPGWGAVDHVAGKVAVQAGFNKMLSVGPA